MRFLCYAWSACAALMLLSGCNRESDEIQSIRIVPTITTRVSDLNFDVGDCIGVTIVKSSGQTFVENRVMTYDGSVFSSSGLVWYDNQNETSTLMAYYPYTSAGVPEEFSIVLDQRSGCSSSDLLGAVKEGIKPYGSAVGMLFHHLLSQLTILVENNTGSAISDITVGGFVPTVLVDYKTLAVTLKPGEAAAQVHAFPVTADETYRVILAPQEAPLTVTVRTADGNSYERTVSSAKLESGKRYNLSAEVSAAGLVIAISGEISGWEDGGSIGEDDPGANPDLPGDDDDPDEDPGSSDDPGSGGSTPEPEDPGSTDDPGTVSHEGETYRTVTVGGQVWMAENMRSMPSGVTLNAGMWYPVGGVDAVATQGMLYDYATATAGAAWSEGVRVQGICPPGWHLPDESELGALRTASDRPADFFCCSGIWMTDQNKYNSSNKGSLLGVTSKDGWCSCLSYTSIAGATPTLSSVSEDYGLTVRCVKD